MLDFIFIVSKHLFPPAGIKHFVRSDIPVPDTISAPFKSELPPLLTCTEFSFSLFSVRDIPENHMDYILTSHLKRRGNHFNINNFTIKPNDLLLDGRNRLAIFLKHMNTVANQIMTVGMEQPDRIPS